MQRRLMRVIVHVADVQDSDGGAPLMATLFGGFPFLTRLFADDGYQGPQFKHAIRRTLAAVTVEIVKRSGHGPDRSATSPLPTVDAKRSERRCVGDRGSRHFNRPIVGLDTGACCDFSEPKSEVSKVVSIDATNFAGLIQRSSRCVDVAERGSMICLFGQPILSPAVDGCESRCRGADL